MTFARHFHVFDDSLKQIENKMRKLEQITINTYVYVSTSINFGTND